VSSLPWLASSLARATEVGTDAATTLGKTERHRKSRDQIDIKKNFEEELMIQESSFMESVKEGL
jgi:hypothetical protein